MTVIVPPTAAMPSQAGGFGFARSPVVWALMALAALGLGSTFSWMVASGAWTMSAVEVAAVIAATVIVCGATFANLAVRWLRWQFLWRRLGLAVPARNSTLVFAAMLPASATPLAVGEVLAGLFLKRYTAMPWTAAIAAWGYSRLADAVALLLLAGIGTWNAWIAIGLLFGLAIVVMMREMLTAGETQSLGTAAVATVLFVMMSVCAWAIPGLGLAAAGWLIAGSADPLAHMSIFATSTLRGALTLVPGGIVTTGSAMVEALVAQGAPLREAVQVVFATRIGTVGFSLLAGAITWLAFRRPLLDLMHGRQQAAQAHFDDLSSSYADEIPAHVRDRLLTRKIALLQETLGSHKIVAPAKGFDLGCGLGWYAIEMAKAGFAMQGGDLSTGQLAGAERNSVEAGLAIDWKRLDGAGIPAADASLDFVYAINVLHHVTNPTVRERLLDDIVRVLRPGGVFILHEINTRNPLFRLYMSYLFPLLRNIDDGTEVWIDPTSPPTIDGARWEQTPGFFTFLPDFVPGAIMQRLLWLERRLEASRWCVWSAHYQLVLTKAS